ncbi:Hypothetical predicted protein [Lecanosticta acicola]|uniref:Uncharacterized protein n=1 Tax=Lecanosticta acicola TaxID=111012 RepID=A0AAI8YZP6_9PEZI|nr:Hypothetical predicted protein [Lecanosticta acicola]
MPRFVTGAYRSKSPSSKECFWVTWKEEEGKVWMRRAARGQSSAMTPYVVEAAPIYYLDNIFNVEAIGFNPYTLITFTRRWNTCIGSKTVKNLSSDTDIVQPRWSVFLAFLKSFYTGDVEACELEGTTFDPNDSFHVATKAFEIVSNLKGLVAWENIEKTLEAWKLSTASLMQWADED